MTGSTKRALAMCAAVCAGVGNLGVAAAHDYWLHPVEFSIRQDSRVAVRMFVGTKGDILEHPYKDSFTVRLDAYDPTGARTRLRGVNYRRPATSLTGATPGVYTVAFQSKHAYIELESDKFTNYLGKEHLNAIVAEREKRGEADKPGRESYFRNCKTLLRVGDGSKGFDRQVGLPFEVTARTNPFAAKPGDALSFHVTYLGKPLAGAYLELIALTSMDTVLGATTDRQGNVAIRVPRAGRWMVAGTRMRRAPDGVRGDWESLWTSLTFELR